jgi:signal peptidase II
MFKKQYITVYTIIVIVLIIDQTLKFWMKTNFTLGQEILPLGTEWFKLHFVENDGMAFGLKLGDSGSWGKLALTLFRLVAVTFLGLFIRSLLRKGEEFVFACSLALVWAGAMGNIIDSMIYGQIFSESGMHAPALLFPQGGGYAPFLHGKVVDMFYFPLYSGVLPSWIPFWGGEYTEFFRPVFNFADAAISVGVALIIVGQLFGGRATAQDDPPPPNETLQNETLQSEGTAELSA